MSSLATAPRRHNPLEHDIQSSGGRLRTKSITGKRKSRSDDDNSSNNYIDARASRKILAIAQDLAEEDESEQRRTAKPVTNPAFTFGSRFANDEEVENATEQASYKVDNDEDADWLPEEEIEEIAEEDLDPEQLAIYKKFLPAGDDAEDSAPRLFSLSTKDHGSYDDHEDEAEEGGQTTNLTALILQRIAEKEALDEARASGLAPDHQPLHMGGGVPEDAVEIPMKVVETFTKVGQILSRYKSGPLPKPFKVLPTLPQWPELLSITAPERWTPNACYRATKIFVSAPSATGQHFLNTVLLERVREDIGETKKLNVHLYNSIKASFYRPAAFFKGFLFPLVESGCTLREATIVSSVLAKIKIPVLHSAAAILRLCEICAEQTSSINSEAAGSANIFIRTLLGKKYALPYKVVDGLVFHFLRFRATKDSSARADGGDDALAASESKLPVLWHRSLLIFAQTYRNEITEDQREALLDLLLVRGHKDIGPEIRRELLAGRNRGQEAVNMDVDGQTQIDDGRDDGDDTMDVA